LTLPLVGSLPLQAPDAEQLVALVELHDSVDEPPIVTALGLAVRVATGMMLTVAVTVLLDCPALLLHTSEYAVLVASGPTAWLPDVPSCPDQPPEAVQADAFVELQVSVAWPPLATTVGAAVNVAAGATLVDAGSDVVE
jgi:hypothetical protein